MNTPAVKTDQDKNIISNLVLRGDLSGLHPEEKVQYYNMFCESLGLNPVTKPFDILKLSGKEVLYAKKDATEQLRKLNGVSVTDMNRDMKTDVYIVTVKVQDAQGRSDMATGAVSIGNLKGDDLANAIMKAETKAKRRATLSICGLGILDESEIETIPNAKKIDLEVKDIETKEDDKKILEAYSLKISEIKNSEEGRQAYEEIKAAYTKGEITDSMAELLQGMLKEKATELSNGGSHA